ncbi:MAG: aromatic amino acid transaminase [Gammaproteobacteria bacterium]
MCYGIAEYDTDKLIMYETLKSIPPDPLLKLIDLYRADSNPDKVDLGVGVYQTEEGITPVLSAIKKAELIRNQTEETKSYFGPAGEPQFGERMRDLILADSVGRIGPERVRVLQSPGGSGGLRVAGELLRRAAPEATVWISTPSWPNHIPLLSTTGLQIREYPYYDHDKQTVMVGEMLQHLRDQAKAGDVVLLHGCCHNPTGADLAAEDWAALGKLCVEKGLLPFLDVAYHGFAAPISDDLAAARALLETVPEAVLAYSCSKNFGLYRDRTGALVIIGKDKTTADTAFSNAYNIIRTMYSVPPHHGAALVGLILADKGLYKEWISELDEMRGRLMANRKLLMEALGQKVAGRDFGFLQKQNGMFSLLGISKEQAAGLIEDFSIYLPGSGRINLAGVKRGNVEYIADSLAKVLAAG